MRGRSESRCVGECQRLHAYAQWWAMHTVSVCFLPTEPGCDRHAVQQGGQRPVREPQPSMDAQVWGRHAIAAFPLTFAFERKELKICLDVWGDD